MPVIQIDGIGDVEVDEGFLKLNPADQQKTVEEIAASSRGQKQTGPDTSFASAITQGVAAPLQGISQTAKAIGMDGVSGAIDAVTPKVSQNYQPAGTQIAQDFNKGYEKDGILGGVKNVDYGFVPRAVTEQLGQFLGSMASRSAGAAIGGAVGGPVGAVAGGFTGPALFEGVQVVGEVATNRAKTFGRDKPSSEDWSYALPTAIASGALNSIGVHGVGKASSGVSGVAKAAGKEGLTEGAQSAVEQTGSTVDTPGGVRLDPGQIFSEGLAGAGAAGGTQAAYAARDVATSSPSADLTNNDSTRRLAQRIQDEATSIGADLGNVDRESPKGAEIVLSNIHNDIAESIKGFYNVLKGELDPMDAATLEQLIERLGVNASIRDAKNKVKSSVSETDFKRLKRLVGDKAEGIHLIDLMRQSNDLTNLFRGGLTGGLSKFTDELSPFGRSSRYLPSGADNTITRLAVTGAGVTLAPYLSAIQLGVWGTGRTVDALTGNRSRTAAFVNQHLGRGGPTPKVNVDGSTSIINQRTKDRQQAAQESARGQELRFQRMNSDDPGVGGFDNSVWQQTGLRPQAAVRGLGILSAQNKISAAEARRYIDNPALLMKNNVGNRIIDQLNTLAADGLVQRDPSWERNPQTIPAPSSGNDAYRAQAAGNQMRVTAAIGRIQNGSLKPNEKNLISSAISRIGKTNNKEGARQILKELEGTLPDSATKALARQEISPLISQIRHNTLEDARRAPRLDLKQAKAGNYKTRKQASAYKLAAGIKSPALEGKLDPPSKYLKKVAAMFERAEHNPNDKAVQTAYAALTAETLAQYEYLGEVNVQAWTSPGEPYKNSTEMMADVQDNKHLWFFTTALGFGTEGAATSEHPMLLPTKHSTSDGTPLVVNDIFRIVHDYFGHTQQGFSFGPTGEYNAYHEHARMFSATALPALAAETLAQNAWVNFGPHLQDANGNIAKQGEPGYVALPARRFADQKAFAVPQSILDEDPNSNATKVSDKLDVRTNPGEREVGRYPTYLAASAARAKSPHTGRLTLDESTDEWVHISTGRTAATPDYKPYEQDPPDNLRGKLVIGVRHPDSGVLLGANHQQVRSLLRRALGEDHVVIGVHPITIAGNGQFDASNMSVKVAQGLDPAEMNRVSSHEAGHAISEISGYEKTLSNMLKSSKLDERVAAKKVRSEMIAISKHARPMLWSTNRAEVERIYQPSSYETVAAYRNGLSEISADFLSIRLTDPSYTARHSPLAHKFSKIVINKGATYNHPDMGKFSLKDKLHLLSLAPIVMAAQVLAAMAMGADDDDDELNKLGVA